MNIGRAMTRHGPQIFRWAALVLVFTACSGFAETPQEFEKAYTIYRKHAANGEWRAALTSAEDAYYLGLKTFGRDDLNTANLAYNYGRLLNRFDRREEARPVLATGLSILEKRYGEDAVQLIDTLTELGEASWTSTSEDASLAYFSRAATLAEKAGPMEQATVNMTIGVFLSNTALSPTAESYLLTARERLDRLFGEKDVRTAIVSMQLAKWQLAREQYGAALGMLRTPLAVFAANQANFGLEIATRAFIVQALEGLGRHDEATRHCLIIGRLSGQGRYLPLVKVQPQYPPAALKQGRTGWVVVEFTVDKEGYVRDARVADASSPVFRDAALAAARQFRYAPRFEGGKPVATTGVQNRITFDIVGAR